MTAPVRRPSVPSAVGENRRRIRVLEATTPPQTVFGGLTGQVANDATIIAGTGFTVDNGPTPADGGTAGAGVYSVYFTVPFSVAPTVVAIANNNNPDVAGEGLYYMSQRAVDVAWVVLLTSDWANVLLGDGGFNFFVLPTV